MASRSERACERRNRWTDEVVRSGQPKGNLYGSLSLQERLAALVLLNERCWVASGKQMPPQTDRSLWPGEVFELERHG